MTDSAADITIVIPNYNGRHFLAPCLDAIRRQTLPPARVTVVDNGSRDGSADWLRRRRPGVHLLALAGNRGFSAAVNAGIRAADSRYVFLLNNDTELAPDCLAELAAAMERYPEAWSLAPKMLDFHRRDRLDGAGDGVFRAGAGYRLGHGETDGPRFAVSRPVFGPCGGAAFYRRSLFERVGDFDEDFFAYLEDVDLNLRANHLGCPCRFVPSARVFHVGSGTTGGTFNDFTVRLTTRNLLLVAAKNFSAGSWLRNLPAWALYHLFWLALAVRNRRTGAYLDGLVAGMRLLTRMRRKHRRWRKRFGRLPPAARRRIRESEDEVLASIGRCRAARGRSDWPLRLYRRVFLRP